MLSWNLVLSFRIGRIYHLSKQLTEIQLSHTPDNFTEHQCKCHNNQKQLYAWDYGICASGCSEYSLPFHTKIAKGIAHKGKQPFRTCWRMICTCLCTKHKWRKNSVKMIKHEKVGILKHNSLHVWGKDRFTKMSITAFWVLMPCIF